MHWFSALLPGYGLGGRGPGVIHASMVACGMCGSVWELELADTGCARTTVWWQRQGNRPSARWGIGEPGRRGWPKRLEP